MTLQKSLIIPGVKIRIKEYRWDNDCLDDCEPVTKEVDSISQNEDWGFRVRFAGSDQYYSVMGTENITAFYIYSQENFLILE